MKLEQVIDLGANFGLTVANIVLNIDFLCSAAISGS